MIKSLLMVKGLRVPIGNAALSSGDCDGEMGVASYYADFRLAVYCGQNRSSSVTCRFVYAFQYDVWQILCCTTIDPPCCYCTLAAPADQTRSGPSCCLASLGVSLTSSRWRNLMRIIGVGEAAIEVAIGRPRRRRNATIYCLARPCCCAPPLPMPSSRDGVAGSTSCVVAIVGPCYAFVMFSCCSFNDVI